MYQTKNTEFTARQSMYQTGETETLATYRSMEWYTLDVFVEGDIGGHIYSSMYAHQKTHIVHSCSCIGSAACGVATTHCWAHLAALVPPNCRTTSYLVAFIADYLSLALSAHWQLAMLVLWVTLWASELNKTKQYDLSCWCSCRNWRVI